MSIRDPIQVFGGDQIALYNGFLVALQIHPFIALAVVHLEQAQETDAK